MPDKIESYRDEQKSVLTVEAPLVVVSDIHLRQSDDERARLLIDLTERLGPSVEMFVLNGDIFDFCFGGGRYFREKFAAIGAALTTLSGRGVRVVFIEGNHEFHMDQIGWEGVAVVQERDFVVTLRSGAKIKLMHGDRLKNERLYLAFRAFCKSKIVGYLSRFLPGKLLDAYAVAHSGYSRGQDKYRTLDHEEILGHFDRWMGAGEPPHGIIGHFHVPYAEPRRTGTGMMLSVDSWDKPNALTFEAGGFSRLSLTKPGEVYARERVKPMLAP